MDLLFLRFLVLVFARNGFKVLMYMEMKFKFSELNQIHGVPL